MNRLSKRLAKTFNDINPEIKTYFDEWIEENCIRLEQLIDEFYRIDYIFHTHNIRDILQNPNNNYSLYDDYDQEDSIHLFCLINKNDWKLLKKKFNQIGNKLYYKKELINNYNKNKGKHNIDLIQYSRKIQFKINIKTISKIIWVFSGYKISLCYYNILNYLIQSLYDRQILETMSLKNYINKQRHFYDKIINISENTNNADLLMIRTCKLILKLRNIDTVKLSDELFEQFEQNELVFQSLKPKDPIKQQQQKPISKRLQCIHFNKCGAIATHAADSRYTDEANLCDLHFAVKQKFYYLYKYIDFHCKNKWCDIDKLVYWCVIYTLLSLMVYNECDYAHIRHYCNIQIKDETFKNEQWLNMRLDQNMLLPMDFIQYLKNIKLTNPNKCSLGNVMLFFAKWVTNNKMIYHNYLKQIIQSTSI